MQTVLIIDDSPSVRAEIRRTLRAANLFDRILEASDGIEGLKLLLSEQLDLVLCDLEMPGMDGEKLLQIKEAQSICADVPVIFLTASEDLDRRVRLLESGASDSITKPFHAADLLARLRLHLKIKRLQDELREKNAVLSKLSTTDHLTGLRTRRYLNEILNVECLRAGRYRSPLTIVMADLDHFKRVNDTYGHLVGDVVLKGTADILRATLRATDVAARWGGEEFLVVLPETDAEGGSQWAERWRQGVEEALFQGSDNRSFRVTMSVGVTHYDDRLKTPEALVDLADQALYHAKDKGRNRVVVQLVGEDPWMVSR